MTSKRSVTAVLSHFPAPSQTFITRKLEGLREAGYDVHVAATTFAPGASDFGFALHAIAPYQRLTDVFDPIGRAGWAGMARGARRLATSDRPTTNVKKLIEIAPLADIRSDIVHFEFSGIAVNYRAAFDLLRPAKLVVSCRGAAEQIQPLADPRRAGLLREVFEQMDLIHCVSDDIRTTVEALGAPPDRILVNRPAVPVAAFGELAVDRVPATGPLRVLSVGRLHWKKGFDDGLRAVSQATLQGTACEYRVGGEGAEREKLAFLTHQLGLVGVAHLLGTQTQQQVLDLLAWADVLLLPSLSEGISNAVLEAMAAGLPVIATRSGGMDEVINPGVDGVLVDVGDVAEMARWLVRLSEDPALRTTMGAAAAARAIREFDISRQIETFVDAYERLTSDRSDAIRTTANEAPT